MARDIKYDDRAVPPTAGYTGDRIWAGFSSDTGRYNIFNALAATAAAWSIGISCRNHQGFFGLL